MRLSDFIESSLEPILDEWQVFARSIAAGARMNRMALRDHAADILRATVADMQSSQTTLERSEKAKGHHPQQEGSAALNAVSELHALGRLGSGFNLLEVVSEYRALRASVLRLWHDSIPAAHKTDLEDVTRFNESIDQLITKSVRSFTQRVDQARDMFLAILSHDLRNPLNSIAMSAQALPLVGSDSDEGRSFTEQIATNVSVMTRMIGDLLDYTRTRLGTGMPVSPKSMDLDVLGRELFNEFRTAHRDRDIRYLAEGNLQGEWDADRVRQAISNLMGNAVQHGIPSVPVELRLRAKGADVHIEVRNGGTPISAGEMPRIFDPLVRGSSDGKPRSNRPGSIGLGLYIAREVAKSHGGTLNVTSTAADGTCFTLCLPRHAAVKTAQPVMDETQIQNM
ncbi:MAG: Histidine Kinase [Phycisphaerales bacterium]|nr:Histidine Kinase [Phycisphaerales bacterium]